MRLHTLVSWVFISGLRRTLALSEENGRSPLCIKIEEDGHLTPEQANKTFGPWAKTQYENWKKTGAHDELWYWLHKKWAPDAAGSIIECKLSSMCSVVTCGLIDDRHDLQDQWNAYWTLEPIAIFHNMAYEIRKSNLEASESIKGDVRTLVSSFSDGSNIEEHKVQHERHGKLACHIVCGAAMLIAAICTFGSAAIGLGLGMSVATVEALENAKRPEMIRLIGASVGLFGTEATMALNFQLDMIDASHYVSKMTETLEHSQMQNQDRVVDRFDAYVNGLFSGNDSSITYLVQHGGYVKAERVLTPEYNKRLRERWAASYISSIWNIEKTYIVMADTGDCESDSRGFERLRVCLQEAPQYVFYAFSKSRVREGAKDKAFVRGPIGHKSLKSCTGFTLEDVVRASYVYSKRHGYGPNSGSPEGSENLVDSFFGPASITEGGKAHGLFNIPILYSPGGQAISSINTKHNRNYPCMAAALPWSENGHGQRRSLRERNEAWTENDPETMFQFLNVTGFYQSEDWWQYCTDKGEHHGNHCKGNKNIDWTGKFGEGQFGKIHHPFKHCKARKGDQHGFVGCEDPKNNGYDQNGPKACGGRKAMAEGLVAEDNTQWLSGTALEADDTEEDEGNLSEWTDREDECGGNVDEVDTIGHSSKTGITSRFYA